MKSNPTPSSELDPNERNADNAMKSFVWFQRVWAVFALGLFAATWKLWTPQTEFPQIPFFEFLVDVPGIVDWILLASLAVSLLACAFGRSDRVRRIGQFAFALIGVGLISLNQHRLQPWAYQFVIFALIMAMAQPKHAIYSMRLIVVSIYIYSAVSKFDYQFVHTVGSQMLGTIVELLGQDLEDWSESVRSGLVFGMPTGELLVGCGLLLPQTRRVAIGLAVLLHVVLLAILLKLGHSPGVICWNLYFVCQAILLFGVCETEKSNSRSADSGADSLRPQSRYRFNTLSAVVTGFVLLFPLTQPLGICDHWVAWEVYSPRTSRAATIVTVESDTPRSQDTLAWSEQTMFVPVYPQARFQLAVAMADLHDYDTSYSVEFKGVANRWNGTRSTETFSGDQMKMRASKFWLNIKPRRIWTERNAR